MLVTADELLGHAKMKEKESNFKVYINELDREIECNVISRKEYTELILGNSDDVDAELIYNSCDIFKDDKLIRNLDCSMNPFDVVGKILSSSTIYGLAKTILKKSNIEQGNPEKYVKLLDDDIKN